tara:strand:+ start:438 stop:620 length:183 start_codon:yes stop_codon:yes gene_type:complete
MNNAIILFVLGVMIVPQLLIYPHKQDDLMFIKSLIIFNLSFPNCIIMILSILLVSLHLVI